MRITLIIIFALSFIALIITADGESKWSKIAFEITQYPMTFIFGIAATYLYANYSYCKTLYQILSKGLYYKEIRVSFSYLFRITVKDEHGKTRYLLVRNEKMGANTYQPVGGVYKYYDKQWLSDLGARDADNFHQKRDLRLKIKGCKLRHLLSDFDSQKSREIDHSREFYEELIMNNILSKNIFPWVDVRYVGRRQSGLRRSDHFECWEINFHDILELQLNDNQEQAIKNLLNKEYLPSEQSEQFIMADENLINRKGNDGTRDIYKITEHTVHILNRK